MNDSPKLFVDGAVATITMQRPDKANRLTPDDLDAVYSHIAAVNAIPEVLVLRLQAGGKYFCSGFDVGQVGQKLTVGFGTMVDALELARPVTIAVIQGGVYGGAMDMALACDFRMGVTSADMFWGTSFGGGIALHHAANDDRIKVLAVQVASLASVLKGPLGEEPPGTSVDSGRGQGGPVRHPGQRRQGPRDPEAGQGGTGRPQDHRRHRSLRNVFRRLRREQRRGTRLVQPVSVTREALAARAEPAAPPESVNSSS